LKLIDQFPDGQALFRYVCEYDFEGIVSKKLAKGVGLQRHSFALGFQGSQLKHLFVGGDNGSDKRIYRRIVWVGVWHLFHAQCHAWLGVVDVDGN